LLSFPPGDARHLDIRLHDIKSLEPGVLLNDTMLEFGLRFWFHDLRNSRPLIAGQMHIFSNFFFTKLTTSMCAFS
ncbi:hypothetical protein AURDEDRAFT_77234, partial [Auricularia subglabra TFB-10046 SS5]